MKNDISYCFLIANRLSGQALNNNFVSDISPVANLSLLWHLSLHDNQISDISALANANANTNFTKLRSLFLNNNQISNINPLLSLTNIYNLYLQDNDNIACADLDALEVALGTGIVSRPSSCLP